MFWGCLVVWSCRLVEALQTQGRAHIKVEGFRVLGLGVCSGGFRS